MIADYKYTLWVFLLHKEPLLYPSKASDMANTVALSPNSWDPPLHNPEKRGGGLCPREATFHQFRRGGDG